jgi:hypothetical protein
MADNHKAKAEAVLGRAGYAEGGAASPTPQELRDSYAKSNAALSKLTREQIFERAQKSILPYTNYGLLDSLGQKRGGRVRARKAK